MFKLNITIFYGKYIYHLIAFCEFSRNHGYRLDICERVTSQPLIHLNTFAHLKMQKHVSLPVQSATCHLVIFTGKRI